MKVLIAHARYIQPGGEEAVIDAQAAALVALGHEVVRYDVDNAAITKPRTATQALWSVGAARAVGAVIDRERPHVLHVHNNFQQLSPSIYGAAKKRGVAVVQHVHNARLACINVFFERDGTFCNDCVDHRVTWPGVVHNCYRASLADSVAATVVQLGHRAANAHRYVDAFVSVSAALDHELRHVVPRNKSFICHNGVEDPHVFRNDRGYALFVGRVWAQKGLQVLLDASASVPELPVRIAGDGPDLARFKEQAARRGLRHVSFLGRIDRDALGREFAGARVTVAPSVGLDPLPTTVIEALAAGVATIGSDAGGIPEIVGESGVLVPPTDPVALAAALRDAHANAPRFEALGRAARARYESQFTTAAFGHRLVAIYEAVRLVRR